MIQFISLAGKIEESAGRRKFYLISEKRFLEYEKRMLCDSDCPYTLPMYCLTEEGKETEYYDFTEYIQARDYITKATSTPRREDRKLIVNALSLLSSILETMKGMENYMLFPERYSNHLDTIFIHLSTEKVAFAYYPNDQMEQTLQNRIIQMIVTLKDLYCDEETDQYLVKFIELIDHKNPGLDGMISMLGMMQREVSYIYWNAKDMRRREDSQALAIDEVRSAQSIKHVRWKIYLVQGFFGAGLFAVFLTKRLDFASFAGLTMMAAGLDLWLMKRFFPSASS